MIAEQKIEARITSKDTKSFDWRYKKYSCFFYFQSYLCYSTKKYNSLDLQQRKKYRSRCYFIKVNYETRNFWLMDVIT